MITRGTLETLTTHIYPNGFQTGQDDFGLEWLNANHAIAEQVGIQGYVSARFKDRPTGFEIEVMEPSVRAMLSHHKLPETADEIVAFNRFMEMLSVPFHYSAVWTTLEPHIRSYSDYAWSSGGKDPRAYTCHEGIFSIWRFTDERFRSLCVCDVDTVRKLQIDPDDPDCDEDEPPYGNFAEFTELMSESGGPFEHSTIR